MAQVPKKPPAQLSEMTVLEKGSEVARPSSMGSTRQNIKKMPSEGLTVLPSEPGLVKFERVASPPCAESPCSSRVGSAGRVEKSLQMARKKEASDDRPTRNSKDSVIAQGVVGLQVKHQGTTEDRLLAENQTIQPNTTAPVTTKGDSDSSNADSSDSDDDNDDEVQVPSTNGAAVQVDKLEAPVELKGEFLSAVMDEDYEKAKDLCQKILLLEPDNKVCSEFHAVIVEKIKQEEEDENDGDDDDSEESSDDEDEETDEETDDDSLEDDNDDDDESDSDDDFAMPSGPINLIMGGLPIKLQNR